MVYDKYKGLLTSKKKCWER